MSQPTCGTTGERQSRPQGAKVGRWAAQSCAGTDTTEHVVVAGISCSGSGLGAARGSGVCAGPAASAWPPHISWAFPVAEAQEQTVRRSATYV